MGHVRLGRLPNTRPWARVTELVGVGAGAAQVAAAALAATLRWLDRAHKDGGVVDAVRLLLRLPLAARADDFAGRLRAEGLDVPDGPGLLDVLAAASHALDAGGPATDLGEIARAAAGESLAAVVGGHLTTLFDPAPDDVQRAFARHSTVKQFGALARDFFARFVRKFLDYHVGRATPLEVGDGRRFDGLAAKARFDAELDAHCRERASSSGSPVCG